MALAKEHKLSPSMEKMLRTTGDKDMAVPGLTRSALMSRGLVIHRGPRKGFLTEKGIEVRRALLLEKGWL